MAFRKSDYIVTDIDFDNDEEIIDDDLHQSNQDEVLSQYSNSDLQEFNNFERDIYGGVDGEISFEEQIVQKKNGNSLVDVHETDEDVSDSLRLVLPKILVRPSLGDPIQTYDQLRGQYKHDLQVEQHDNMSSINSDSFATKNSNDKRQSPYNNNNNNNNNYNNIRVSSQASGGSAETVLSQINESIDQPLNKLFAPISKSRNQLTSVSSTESTARQSSKKSHNNNKATQKILLDKEREVRKDQDKYINHLQHTINQLLTKHALAEETIDQLRLGVVINNKTRLREQKPMRRTPNSIVKKKGESRRYSSIMDNANYQEYDDRPSIMSRAKSVDMAVYEEELNNDRYREQHFTNEFGGSMKQIPNSSSKETEIANDIKTIGDYFQSRIKILNEAAYNLQYNSSGRASVSSGSHNGDAYAPGKIVYDNQRHTPLAKRLKNLQTAYQDLQSDFNGFRQINKNSAPEYGLRKDAKLNDVEGDLFELGMKIDDLERTLLEDRLTPTNAHVFENPDRDKELINRFANVEEQYQTLISRYNQLKGARSPSRQTQLDTVVQQLQALVKQADGRYSSIPTPDKLESMMQRDIIDKIKQHMGSDSPPYFLTEEDGLSSGNSSLGKGHRRRKGYRLPPSEEDSDVRPQKNGERLSPIKSRISNRIVDDNVNYHKLSPQQIEKAGSLPVSVVSSSSMWQGATSGETLALDDHGILRDSESRKGGNSSAGSEIFKFQNKSFEEIRESRRQSKNNIGYNPIITSESYLPNNSALHEEVDRIDEQLQKVELEEKRQLSAAARDSDNAGSRNTRSLLGTSPSNSMVSRHSRQPSSVASSHKSQDASTGHRSHLPKEERRRRRMKPRYMPPSLSDSEDETPSEEYDITDYVKSAGCGLGPRSRYVRSKNKNLQDRWSQTPPAFDGSLRASPSHRRSYDREFPVELEDPYIDDVAYWDGVAFHPSRESIPGKSILRRSSQHHQQQQQMKPRRTGLPRPRSLYMPLNESEMLPKPLQPSRLPFNNSFSYYPESNVSREYYKMDPHRYLVREYGQRNNPFESSMCDEDSEDDFSSHDNSIEDRRLRNYLEEAVKAAKSMKRYTKRISDLCEQRKLDSSYAHHPSPTTQYSRNHHDFYSQYS